MLAYDCKFCKKMIFSGYRNEFGEFFCDENCYKIYCGIHGYEVHLECLEKFANKFWEE